MHKFTNYNPINEKLITAKGIQETRSRPDLRAPSV